MSSQKHLLLILLFTCLFGQYRISEQNASKIAGQAQNMYINGNIDEALVKFEWVVDYYPNTLGAVQSLIYLLSDAVKNNDLNAISQLLLDNFSTIEDPVVQSAIFKLRGDVALMNEDASDAVKHYKKAYSGTTVFARQLSIRCS